MVPEIKILEEKVLSDYRYSFTKVRYEYSSIGHSPEIIERAVFHRGNGATILLYNPDSGNIILTRQFRLPTYLNGNPSGMLLEVCAGTLDGDEDPMHCIIRETEEETGFKITEPQKVFEAFMSPGSVTEKLYFFVAKYTSSMKIGKGGGLEDENEYIDVVEMPFQKALELMNLGEIQDAKTLILLLFAQANHLLS